MKNVILELTVRNHPGVMSHISGLFSRRAYNIEGILCGRLDDNIHSRMYLLINESSRTDLMIRQIKRLEDVIDVSVHDGKADLMFSKLDILCNNKDDEK